MAHFAQINENNIVTQVIVVADSDCGGGQYPESDPIGAAFCSRLLGGTWKQTSYNNNFRKHYAGVGYTFDVDRDAFISPKPYPSWLLVEESCLWEAPVPMPNDEDVYYWDESTTSWVVVEQEQV
jgi:hypothetical protein